MKVLFLLLALSLTSFEADVTSGDMLMNAAIRGDLKTMESLLSAGVDPNLPLRDGQSPLSFAMLGGQTQVIELLLAWHADPNVPMNRRYESSDTPLQFAAQSGNLRMATILIAGGAQINTKGPKGRTALH